MQKSRNYEKSAKSCRNFNKNVKNFKLGEKFLERWKILRRRRNCNKFKNHKNAKLKQIPRKNARKSKNHKEKRKNAREMKKFLWGMKKNVQNFMNCKNFLENYNKFREIWHLKL